MLVNRSEHIRTMLEDMKDYMREHNEIVHNFAHNHFGYFCVNRIGCFFSFGSFFGDFSFYEVTESNYDIICALYGAFYNDIENED